MRVVHANRPASVPLKDVRFVGRPEVLQLVPGQEHEAVRPQRVGLGLFDRSAALVIE
jgi:hypothetical protein